VWKCTAISLRTTLSGALGRSLGFQIAATRTGSMTWDKGVTGASIPQRKSWKIEPRYKIVACCFLATFVMYAERVSPQKIDWMVACLRCMGCFPQSLLHALV